MTWFANLLGSLWPRPEPPPEMPNGDRDAQINALTRHHRRLLSDLAHELNPDAQRLIEHLDDDRRFREAGRDG